LSTSPCFICIPDSLFNIIFPKTLSLLLADLRCLQVKLTDGSVHNCQGCQQQALTGSMVALPISPSISGVDGHQFGLSHTGCWCLLIIESWVAAILYHVILHWCTPPKSNPRHPHHRGNILGQQTGLWSIKAKVWGIVLKAAWNCGGDSRVTNDPFRTPGSTPLYVCLPSTWGCAGGDCLIPKFLWD
jgi:hypothetical protein